MLGTAFLALWLGVNAVTFVLYGMDKYKAKKGKWRIPEKTLLLPTWLLGGVGAWLGMRAFRHKTKHLAFMISAPVGALLSIAVLILVMGNL